jgi:hypothetical protein
MEIKSLFYFVAGVGVSCLMNHLIDVGPVGWRLVWAYIGK